jgi:hypothetical protein
MAKIVIKSNTPELYSYLKSNIPEGISLEPKLPMRVQRDISITTSIEFVITIDLTRIVIDTALLYLLTKLRKVGRNNQIEYKGEKFSIEDHDAKEKLKHLIDKE